MSESAASKTLGAANDKAREAAKWLVAGAAAVGATLLAGSQLSSLGSLPIAAPTSVERARFWVAALGSVAALTAVGYILWAAARLLVPVTVTFKDLDEAWPTEERPQPPKSLRHLAGPIGFLRRNEYLQGYASPAALIAEETTLKTKLRGLDRQYGAASGRPQTAEVRREGNKLRQALEGLRDRRKIIQAIAQNRVVEERTSRLFDNLLVAAATAAIGIVAFAWAANPADTGPALSNTSLVGADLKGANLTNADLTNADLTDADLTGAELTGATIDGVTWHNTTCPDGKNSDDIGGTCRGHL